MALLNNNDDGQPMGGLVILVSMITLAVVGGVYQYHKVSALAKSIDVKAAILDVSSSANRQQFDKIDFYEANKDQIDSVWEFLSSGLPGPKKVEDLVPLQSLGAPTIKPKFNEIANSPGFVMTTDKAEFQKVLAAVADLEGKFALLQITRIEIRLPAKVAPMLKQPTYLSTQLEFEMPR